MTNDVKLPEPVAWSIWKARKGVLHGLHLSEEDALDADEYGSISDVVTPLFTADQVTTAIQADRQARGVGDGMVTFAKLMLIKAGNNFKRAAVAFTTPDSTAHATECAAECYAAADTLSAHESPDRQVREDSQGLGEPGRLPPTMNELFGNSEKLPNADTTPDVSECGQADDSKPEGGEG